jgi:DNA-binding response OmpR family regulator
LAGFGGVLSATQRAKSSRSEAVPPPHQAPTARSTPLANSSPLPYVCNHWTRPVPVMAENAGGPHQKRRATPLMLVASNTLEIDPERRQLRRSGREITTQPLVFDLLLYFARQPCVLVTKDMLVRSRCFVGRCARKPACRT